MGIFDGIARAFGDLRSLSDQELQEQYEMMRLRSISHKDLDNEFQRLENELSRYNAEIARRMNEAHDPEQQGPPRGKHGWHLTDDD